jgi:hypothetical protein
MPNIPAAHNIKNSFVLGFTISPFYSFATDKTNRMNESDGIIAAQKGALEESAFPPNDPAIN